MGFLSRALESEGFKFVFGLAWTLLIWVRIHILGPVGRAFIDLLNFRIFYWICTWAVVILAISQAITISQFILTTIPQVGVSVFLLFAIGFVLFGFSAVVFALAAVIWSTLTFLGKISHPPVPSKMVDINAPVPTFNEPQYTGAFDAAPESVMAEEEALRRWSKMHGFTEDDLRMMKSQEKVGP